MGEQSILAEAILDQVADAVICADRSVAAFAEHVAGADRGHHRA